MDEGLEEGRAEGGGVEFVQEIGVGGGHGDGACCLTIISCLLCFLCECPWFCFYCRILDLDRAVWGL